MFRPKLVVDVKGEEERVYRFECDPSAPLGEISSAVSAIKKFVDEKIKEINEKEESSKEEPKSEDDKEESDA